MTFQMTYLHYVSLKYIQSWMTIKMNKYAFSD